MGSVAIRYPIWGSFSIAEAPAREDPEDGSNKTQQVAAVKVTLGVLEAQIGFQGGSRTPRERNPLVNFRFPGVFVDHVDLVVIKAIDKAAHLTIHVERLL